MYILGRNIKRSLTYGLGSTSVHYFSDIVLSAIQRMGWAVPSYWRSVRLWLFFIRFNYRGLALSKGPKLNLEQKTIEQISVLRKICTILMGYAYFWDYLHGRLQE